MLSVVPPAPMPATPEQLVTSAPELEALPLVAQRVLTMLRDDNTTVDKIANVLGSDQAMTAAVLRYANSARAMPNRPIVSLRGPVARIRRLTRSEGVVRRDAGPVRD